MHTLWHHQLKLVGLVAVLHQPCCRHGLCLCQRCNKCTDALCTVTALDRAPDSPREASLTPAAVCNAHEQLTWPSCCGKQHRDAEQLHYSPSAVNVLWSCMTVCNCLDGCSAGRPSGKRSLLRPENLGAWQKRAGPQSASCMHACTYGPVLVGRDQTTEGCDRVYQLDAVAAAALWSATIRLLVPRQNASRQTANARQYRTVPGSSMLRSQPMKAST